MKKAIRIKENIYWVGGIDWNLRNFHGYLTQRGSTYNSYLIIDEKVVLIDTVKYYLADELIERISSVIDPSKIDIIISNHVEMDHSGSLDRIFKLAPNATLYASPNGFTGLSKHFDTSKWKFEKLTADTKLNIGKRTLEFIFTPMVHWPDNMFTYLPEDKILFSNDAFGMHLASSERFDDEYPFNIIMEEAKKYYANIVMPYGMQVQKALSMVADKKIEIIANSHGIIWRKYIPEIIAEYVKWSKNETVKKAVIIYDSMWNSTEKMAKAIEEGFLDKGYVTSLRNLRFNHISDIITEVLDSEYVCIGSPTLNNNILPTVSAFLTYLKGLAPKGRKAIVFGSFGWGGQSVSILENEMKTAKFDVVYSKKIQYIPKQTDLNAITEDIKNL